VHVRATLLAGDPARLGEALRFLEEEARPEVESEEGNLGMAVFGSPELGVAVLEMFWVSAEAGAATERTVSPIIARAAKLAVAPASPERYTVALFVHATRPHPGAGVRWTRIESAPERTDDAVAAYEGLAVPALAQTDGFCEALMFVDRSTGRSVSETVWRDTNALAASRSTAAAVRVDMVSASDAAVRSVEEYRLMFSSVRRE
jgi:quinol monooxygenase YgiN